MAAAVRRRLEQLGRDLGGPKGDPARPAVVPAPGRHSRGRAVPETRLRRAHLPLLGCLAAVALVAVGWFAVRGDPDPDPVPVARTAPAVPSSGPSEGPSSAGAPADAPSSSPAVVVVDVAGKVRRPGVATLPSGSRVVDALRRAGGARPGVDLSGLNLARVLTDGEQVLVGTKPAGGSAAGGSGSGSGPGDRVLVNLNTADLTELDALPGVGPVTARKIVEWRTENGSFSAVDELLEVDGIGAKTLAELAPCVTL